MKPALLIAMPLWAAALVGTLRAQIPNPRLDAVFPPGGQIGTEVEVRVSGGNLEGPASLLVSDPDIAAEPVASDAGEAQPGLFRISIPEARKPGVVELWVHGAYGISNSRLFAIGARSEFADHAPSSTPGKAHPVSLGTTVHGRALEKARCHYRVFVLEGQRLIVSCLARELDSAIEPVLELYDSQGRLVARDLRGRILDHRPGVSQAFHVAIHDRLYRGGDAYFYRLAIHAGPHIDHVLPLSVAPGGPRDLILLGRNLPEAEPAGVALDSGLPLERAAVRTEVPFPEGTGELAGLRHLYPGFPLHRSLPAAALGLLEDPLPLRLGIAPRQGTAEAPLSGEEDQVLEPPVSVTGLFHPAGDRDAYRFRAEKGKRYRIEVRSSRLGYPTSPMVEVEGRDAQGEARSLLTLNPSFANLGDAAFPLHAWDCSGWFQAPGTGEYTLAVRDLFNQGGSDAQRLYELCIREPRPGFRAVSVAQSALHRNIARNALVEPLTLLSGQVLPVRIHLERIDGFGGPVRLAAGKAPPGIQVHLPPPGGDLLFLEARPGSPSVAGDLELFAEGEVEGRKVRLPVEHGQVARGVGDYRYEPVLARLSPHRKAALSAHRPFPVRVVPRKSRWSASVAGRLSIPVQVERHGGFDQKLDLKIRGSGALERHPGLTVEKESGELAIDLGEHKLDPGVHRFHLFAETRGKFRHREEGREEEIVLGVYSPPLEVEVLSAPFRIAVEDPVPLGQGGERKVEVRIERLFGFEGQIDFLAEGAPGVRVAQSPQREDRLELTLALEPDASPPPSVRLRALGRYNGTAVEAVRALRIAPSDPS